MVRMVVWNVTRKRCPQSAAEAPAQFASLSAANSCNPAALMARYAST